MSLVSIFCSFVRRLPASFNIQARPIGFPGVLLAGVANRGQENWVYVNVFAGGRILEMADLVRMLSEMGLVMSRDYLCPATAKEMVSSALPLTTERTRKAHFPLDRSVFPRRPQHPHLSPKRRRQWRDRPHLRHPFPLRRRHRSLHLLPSGAHHPLRQLALLDRTS
jgi:hypothetical protein